MSQSSNNSVTLVAGGTGGHMFPALAVALNLQKQGHKVQVITDKRGAPYVEASLSKENISLHILAGGGLQGTILTKMKAMMLLAYSHLKSIKLLRASQTKVVIGFGGYISFPVLLAAKLLRIKTLIHEQNAVLGRVNRLLAKYVDVVALSWPHTVPKVWRTAKVTGMPLRASVLPKHENTTKSAEEDFTLFVLGGSQGARLFSELLPAALALLPRELQGRLRVIQQCRPEDLEQVRSQYTTLGIKAICAPFFEDVPQHYQKADLIISRAGASTLAELMAWSKPAILIPLSTAADNHQVKNCDSFKEEEAAVVLEEKYLSPKLLSQEINSIAQNPQLLLTMTRNMKALAKDTCILNAADLLADLALTLVHKRYNYV